MCRARQMVSNPAVRPKSSGGRRAPLSERSVCAAIVIALSLGLASPQISEAQHPIEIERAAAQQEYLRAMVTFDKLPNRRATTNAIIAAARSAWALSLPGRASREFERALRDETLTPTQRAELLLARGIIEFQEERYQVATLFAERGVSALKIGGPLRAQILLLWGDTLMRLGSPGAASDKYEQALAESTSTMLPDVNFKRGSCKYRLGQYEAARDALETIPVNHEHAPEAMRMLAQIGFETRRYDQVEFWLKTGRERFADQFLDSWVDYARISAAIARNDLDSVNSIAKAAAVRFPASDPWMTLLNAATEAFLWSRATAGREQRVQTVTPEEGK